MMHRFLAHVNEQTDTIERDDNTGKKPNLGSRACICPW